MDSGKIQKRIAEIESYFKYLYVDIIENNLETLFSPKTIEYNLLKFLLIYTAGYISKIYDIKLLLRYLDLNNRTFIYTTIHKKYAEILVEPFYVKTIIHNLNDFYNFIISHDIHKKVYKIISNDKNTITDILIAYKYVTLYSHINNEYILLKNIDDYLHKMGINMKKYELSFNIKYNSLN